MLSITTTIFFFFNDTATTEIYTLSLHDALPISKQTRSGTTIGLSCFARWSISALLSGTNPQFRSHAWLYSALDRKSTRLNSSHLVISYAVFCLKKKKNTLEHYDQEHIPTASH